MTTSHHWRHKTVPISQAVAVADLAYDATLRALDDHRDSVRVARTYISLVTTVGVTIIIFLGKEAVDGITGAWSQTDYAALIIVGGVTAAFGLLFAYLALRPRRGLMFRLPVSVLLPLQAVRPHEAKFRVAQTIENGVIRGQAAVRRMIRFSMISTGMLVLSIVLWVAAIVVKK